MGLPKSQLKAREMEVCQLLSSLMGQSTCKQLNGRKAVWFTVQQQTALCGLGASQPLCYEDSRSPEERLRWRAAEDQKPALTLQLHKWVTLRKDALGIANLFFFFFFF